MASQISTLRQLVPHIDAIHEIRADAAEECLLAMGVDVPMLPSTFNILMGLRSEVLQWDLRPAYRNYKQVLQLLQHQRIADQAIDHTATTASAATSGAAADPSPACAPPPRWVLKSPMHLGYTSALREVFPDANIVWMHRDPTESLPSLCSLFRTFQETFYQGPLNLKEIGYLCSAFWEAMLLRAHQDLSKHRNNNGNSGGAAAQVRYKDLVKDPLGTVQGLYKAFGWTYSDAFDQALKVRNVTVAWQDRLLFMAQLMQRFRLARMCSDLDLIQIFMVAVVFWSSHHISFSPVLFFNASQADLEKQKAERAASKQASSSGSSKGGGGSGSGHHGNATGNAAHAYSMEEYGLDQDAMKERLDWYYKAYL